MSPLSSGAIWKFLPLWFTFDTLLIVLTKTKANTSKAANVASIFVGGTRAVSFVKQPRPVHGELPKSFAVRLNENMQATLCQFQQGQLREATPNPSPKPLNYSTPANGTKA